MNKKGEKDIFFKIGIYTILSFILGLAIWDMFNIPYRSITWFGSFIILLVVYVKFKEIPKYLYILLAFTIIANIFGEVFGEFFYNNIHYDKILHLINPIILAWIFHNIFKKKIENKNILIAFSALLSFTLSVIWELFEYLMDHVFGAYMQGVYLKTKYDILNIVADQTIDKLNDTMLDLTFGLIGLIIFAAIFYLVNKKERNKRPDHTPYAFS